MKEATQSVSQGMEQIESSLEDVVGSIDRETRNEVEDAPASAEQTIQKIQQRLEQG